jgi:hypothetical protein
VPTCRYRSSVIAGAKKTSRQKLLAAPLAKHIQVLQHNRGKSGHRADIANRSLVTHFDISAGSFAVPHNDHFGGLEIDSQFEFHRLLDRQSAGFAPLRILTT